MAHSTREPTVRRPAVAGTFMQASPELLAQEVDHYLQSDAALDLASACPKVLIAPHAGHIYSGRTAGRAYALVRAFGQHGSGRIRRVVLLGPAHRVYVKGIALPGVDAYATPLGLLPVDTLGALAVEDLPFVVTRPDVHGPEHSLEVQVPFLQRALGQVQLLPLVVGDVSAAQVAQVIERLWGGDDVLLVVSTDLSHFHAYDEANAIDHASCEQVLALDGSLTHEQACGATPLNGLLSVARNRGLRIAQLEQCNSGDTGANTSAGRARVVGYASFALYESAPGTGGDGTELSEEQGARLVALARHALQGAVTAGAMGAPQPPKSAPSLLAAATDLALQANGASFVTLTQNGQLRGCIGSLQAYRPLVQDVQANACAAALQDPRFPPVSANEAPGLRLEVSVLAAAQPLSFANQAHALWQLQPGVHGVIFECVHQGRSYRSTFLPQVWEQLPNVVTFMAHLKAKAGLAQDFWSSEVRLSVYRVQKFKEAER
jgi:MEMO1 family protein